MGELPDVGILFQSDHMTLYFLLPRTQNLSGGTLYNEMIMEWLDIPYQIIWLEGDFPSVVDSGNLPKFGKKDIVVIDSLLLPALCSELDRFPKVIVLRHFLPSVEFGVKECHHRNITTNVVTGKILQEYFSNSALIIPGIDHVTDYSPPATRNEFALLCVGAITPLKNQIRGLDLIEMLPDRYTLTFAGAMTNDYAKNVISMVRQRELEDRIRFVGELNLGALCELYRRSSLLLSFSKFEAYGIAISEAMVFGLPTIAISSGNLRYTIGDAGVLVNTLEEMATQIQRLCDNGKTWKSLSDRCRTRGSELPTWKEQSEKLAAVILELGGDPVTFSTDWLFLRSEYDSTARNGELRELFLQYCSQHRVERIYDLGAGFGHNALYISKYIKEPMEFVLIEINDGIIARGIRNIADQFRRLGEEVEVMGQTVTVRGRQNISFRYENRDLFEVEHFEGAVICNALLDVLPPNRLHELLGRASIVYATLNYVGTTINDSQRWTDLYDDHMRKSGRIGPDILNYLPKTTSIKPSIWQLSGMDKEIEGMILDYMENSIPDLLDDDQEFKKWINERRDDVRRGVCKMDIRHVDVLYVNY